MLKAAVDIGTNSTRLFIADVTGEALKRVEKHTTITRLGKQVDSSKSLGQEGIERNVKLLLQYKKIAESYGIKQIKAIATSAVRDAANREEFVHVIRQRTGIAVDVISGMEEAKLGFAGASLVLDGGPVVVCDIGGGSTELIWGEGKTIEGLQSVDIGAVRMTERYINPHEIKVRDIKEAEGFIEGAVYDPCQRIGRHRDFTLVCIGGTATTLAAMDQKLSVYDVEKVHGYKLTFERVMDIFEELLRIPLEDRKRLPGLQEERADIMPAGTLILKTIMRELNVSYALVSESDNLDGIMIQS